MKSWAWKAIGLLILAYLAWRLDWARLGGLLAAADWRLMGLATLLSIPVMGLKSLRWRGLLRQQGIIISGRDSFIYYMASLYIGFITPGRLGEFTKAAYLKTASQVNPGLGLSSVAVDRLLDLYLVAVLALAGAAWSDLWPWARAWACWGLALALLAPAGLAWLDRRHPLPEAMARMLSRKNIPAFMREGLGSFASGMRLLMTPRLTLAGLPTVLSYGLFFIQCFLLAWAVGLPLSFWEVIPVMSITNLASLLPISISGLGVREGALAAMLGGRAPLETIMAFSFAVFAATYLASGLMGLAAFWRAPLDMTWRKDRGGRGGPRRSD